MVSKNKTFYSKRLHHTSKYKGFVAKRFFRSATVPIPLALTFLYFLRSNENLYCISSTMTAWSNRKYEMGLSINLAPNDPTYIIENIEASVKYDAAKKDYESTKRNGIIIESALSAASLAYIVFICTHS